MNNVNREEILDYVTYEEQRAAVRENIMKIKEVRRINVGGILPFVLNLMY